MSDAEPISSRDYEINLPEWAHNVKYAYQAAKITSDKVRRELVGKERSSLEDEDDYREARKLFNRVIQEKEQLLPGAISFTKKTEEGDRTGYFISKTKEICLVRTSPDKTLDLKYDPDPKNPLFVGFSEVRRLKPHELSLQEVSEDKGSLSYLTIDDMAQILGNGATKISEEEGKGELAGISEKLFVLEQKTVEAYRKKEEEYGLEIKNRFLALSDTLRKIPNAKVPEWIYIKAIPTKISDIETGLFFNPYTNKLCKADITEKRDWKFFGTKRTAPDLRPGHAHIYETDSWANWVEAADAPERMIEEVIPTYQAWIMGSPETSKTA